MKKAPYKIYPLSETALTLQYPAEISWKLIQHLYAVRRKIENAHISGIRRTEVSFYELTIFYNPKTVTYSKLENKLSMFLAQDIDPEETLADQQTFHLPVCYDLEMAMDVERIEDHTRMDFSEIIQRHMEAEYRVYMMGFLPGFLYLGGMDEQIACPRHDIPRKMIPVGSVGIAGRQTGIYPINSPGGWNIIGRMPLQLFDWSDQGKQDPVKGVRTEINPLDRIQFVSISREEYEKWEGNDLQTYLTGYKMKG